MSTHYKRRFEDEKVFRINLKNFREQKGLNQYQLSRLANISRQTLCHYETGRRFPSNYTLWRLCQALDVEVEEMLGIPTVKKVANEKEVDEIINKIINELEVLRIKLKR